MYIDDKFEEFDIDQENFKGQFESIRSELDEQVNLMVKENLTNNINVILNQFTEKIDKLAEINTNNLESSENLDEQIIILEGLSKNISSMENAMIENLNSGIEDLSGNLTKNANKVIGNLINLSKESKNFLSDLKAAIILLESSKTPLQNKLDTQVIEIKTLQKTISDLKSNNQNLITKIEKLEKREA
jgi:hypothetical protein